jgi:hypothetical protein
LDGVSRLLLLWERIRVRREEEAERYPRLGICGMPPILRWRKVILAVVS